MKSLLSMLAALIMVLTMSQPGLILEDSHTGTGFAVVAKEIAFAEETDPEADAAAAFPVYGPESVCLPPVRETEPEEAGTIDREGDGVTAPPVHVPESACLPPVQETEPEEAGTIDWEGDGVACPPPWAAAPISEEEPEVPEETIALEPDPVAGPPMEEPPAP